MFAVITIRRMKVENANVGLIFLIYFSMISHQSHNDSQMVLFTRHVPHACKKSCWVRVLASKWRGLEFNDNVCAPSKHMHM